LSGEWRDVVGYEGLYEVSNHGHVRNRRGLVLKPDVTKSGHHRVNLYIAVGQMRHFQVHRLVARAFIGESELDVLHWDDVPSNNHVINLRYGTDSENWYDAARNGKRRLENFCLRGHDYPKNKDGYIKKRCYPCEFEAGRKRYWEEISEGLHANDPRHGTYAGYRAGCRCLNCKGANKVYKAKYYLAYKAGKG